MEITSITLFWSTFYLSDKIMVKYTARKKSLILGSALAMLFLCPVFGSVVYPPEIWTVAVTYPNGVNQRNFIGVQVKASEDTVTVQYWLLYPNGTRYSDGEGDFMTKWRYQGAWSEWYYFYTCWQPPEEGLWTLVLFAYYRFSNYPPEPDIVSVEFYITNRTDPLPASLSMSVINIRE